MTLDEIIAKIEALSDPKDCARVIGAATERHEALYVACRQRAVTERWSRLEKCRSGTVLYCTTSGVFLGGPLQRGDSVKVVSIDYDREILYLRLHRVRGKLVRTRPDEVLAFRPRDCVKYGLERKPPEKTATASEQKTADMLREVVDALNDTGEAKALAGGRR